MTLILLGSGKKMARVLYCRHISSLSQRKYSTIGRRVRGIMIKLFVGFSCIACSVSSDDRANYSALETIQLVCPEGAHDEYRSLEEKKVMLLCLINHGPYVAAEKGYAVLEGINNMGRSSDDVKLLDPLGPPAKRNYDALKVREPKCPNPAKPVYRPWGPNGFMVICQIEHGPFAVAENERVVLKGENNMGNTVVTWQEQ
jgi:hypothetical protein